MKWQFSGFDFNNYNNTKVQLFFDIYTYTIHIYFYTKKNNLTVYFKNSHAHKSVPISQIFKSQSIKMGTLPAILDL